MKDTHKQRTRPYDPGGEDRRFVPGTPVKAYGRDGVIVEHVGKWMPLVRLGKDLFHIHPDRIDVY